MGTTREKLLALEIELNHRYIDRVEEVHGLILAALSHKHVEYLGPPGNAKSAMVRDFTSMLGGSYAYWLMTQDTSPDEVFGPLDIQALKAGRYERKVQGKLPDVHVGVLDEVYKANSRVLNGALGVLQERKFSNSGVEINCPLVFCVGSSNELPEREAHLDAFRDRFLLRYNPGYFTDVSQLGQMLRLRANGKKGEVEKVGIEELSQAHHEAMALVLSQEAQDSVELVWQRLGDEGIVQSPRRYMQLLDVMAAESWLMGETGIVADSVMVARHVLWTDPKDIRKVEAVVRQSVNPSLAIAEEIHQAAIQAWEGLGYIPTSDALIQFMQQIARMKGEVEKLSKSKAVTDIAATLGEYQTLCMNRMLNPNGTGIAAMGKGRVN